MSKIFITSTLPYANSYRPHIGHLFEFILTDSIVRFYKSLHGKENVFFNTGLDQNGTKILQKANELNLPLDEFLSGVSKEWKLFCQKFHIEYDNFYETSSKQHSENVINAWNYFLNKGDIYEKEYTGKYCIGCESFKLDKDLVDGKCSDHPTSEIEIVLETNYFFNLSKYNLMLSKWINKNPLVPNSKYPELVNFINEYGEISVSRKKTTTSLGIDVPNKEDQVIYVWCDALLNYIFACEQWNNWNNCEIIQTCGPDNLRFQGQIFQAFLASLGKKFSDKIIVHGTILDKNGKKMSKSEGNVIDPIEQLEKFGLDAIRYYTLAGLNTTTDSAWDEEKLINQFNSEICNDWGNLVSRVLHLIDTKLEGKTCEITTDFLNLVNNYEDEVVGLWHNFKIKDALQKTNELVKYANKYINDEQPWNNLDRAEEVLSNLYHLIKVVATLYVYVFPNRSDIFEAIENKKKVILFNKIEKVKL